MAIQFLNLDEPAPGPCRGGAVTIGNFDGVHRGHQELLHHLRSQAHSVGGPAVALTFDPHPLKFLRPELVLTVLTTVPQRAELLQAYGADAVVILRTTPELLRLGPREFFERVLRTQLDARALQPGFNFNFGRNREGNADTLAVLCRESGIGFAVVGPMQMDGQPISSSRIRDELLHGAVRRAADLLGRPYRLRGKVGTGQRRGQQLGFPTANLEEVATVVPADGVYAVRVSVDGKVWPAAANVGANPTFGEQARKIEAHLIGFSGDLYGQELAVDFVERLRDTRTFAGPGELAEQLRQDVARARECLSGE